MAAFKNLYGVYYELNNKKLLKSEYLSMSLQNIGQLESEYSRNI